jgi:hypothetical protein
MMQILRERLIRGLTLAVIAVVLLAASSISKGTMVSATPGGLVFELCTPDGMLSESQGGATGETCAWAAFHTLNGLLDDAPQIAPLPGTFTAVSPRELLPLRLTEAPRHHTFAQGPPLHA